MKFTITDVTWSSWYQGSLELKINGVTAFVPTDRIWWAEMGCIYLIGNSEELDSLNIPTHTFPRTSTRSEQSSNRILPCPKLARRVQELHRALNDGTFEDGRVVEAGPIEIEIA